MFNGWHGLRLVLGHTIHLPMGNYCILCSQGPVIGMTHDSCFLIQTTYSTFQKLVEICQIL